MSDPRTENDIALFGTPRWGFVVDGTFVPIPRAPLLAENPERRPPFEVVLPSGAVRMIVLEVGGG